MLGADGRFVHHYGATVNGTGVGRHDYWALEYDIEGGEISLELRLRPHSVNLERAVVTNIRCGKHVEFERIR